MGMNNQGYGQTKSFLTGVKTGNYFGGALITLGRGSASLSKPPMSEHVYWLDPKFYYAPTNILIENTTNPVKMRAAQDLGILGLIGAGADVYIQFRNTGNTAISSGTTTYFKLKEKPTLSGLSVGIGGLLGLVELQNIQGRGYSNASIYNLTNAGNENNGNLAGSATGTTTEMLIDKDGEWFAAVTPDANYNSVRLNVALPADLRVADIARSLEVNVYNAFTLSQGNNCSSRPIFTNPGEATGINLNTGAIGLPLNELVSNPHFAINNNTNDYSSFTTGVANLGVASTISQTFYFDHLSPSDGSITLRLGLTQSLVDLNLLGNGVKFKIYNNNTIIGTEQNLRDNILGLNLLNLISVDGDYKLVDVSIKPTEALSFNKLVIEYNTGLVNANVLGDALRIYDVNLSASKPIFTNSVDHLGTQTICAGGVATFSPISNPNYELLWYESLDATSPIAITAYNEVFLTPNLYNNKTYYVANRIIGCVNISERIPANVIVNPLPTINLGNTDAICEERIITALNYISTTNNPTSYSISWDLNAKSAGFIDQTNITLDANVISIPIPTGVTANNYSGTIRVKNDLGCESTDNTFNLKVYPKPSPPQFNLQ